MRRKSSVLAVIAALVIGGVLFAAPSTSHAVLISTVSVTITGASTPSFALWAPQAITGSQTLVLASTGGGGNFNFDVSDVTCATGPCPAAVIHVNGQDFTDTTRVLTLKNADPVGNAFNEAQGYTLLGISSGGDFSVSIAYADNLHTDACGTGATAVGLVGNPGCLPTPFTGADFFQGLSNAEFDTIGSNHPPCTATSTSGCWDSGVILIQAITHVTPEPSSLLLLGAGLIGLVAYGRKRFPKNA